MSFAGLRDALALARRLLDRLADGLPPLAGDEAVLAQDDALRVAAKADAIAFKIKHGPRR